MKTSLYNKTRLKKTGAILLLLIFALGITPKKTLHDWFANHKDNTAPFPGKHSQELGKSGINCDCVDLVAESHFITFGSHLVINAPTLHSFVALYTPKPVYPSLFHNNLRGPPLKF